MARVNLERSPAYCDELTSNLWDLSKDDVWTDFAIFVGNRKLPCHRVVLAANSPMLRAAISADMAERRTGEINLDLFSVAVIEVVLQYMYMGEVTIDSRLLKDLLLAADYLQMRVLKKQCIDLIPGNIDITPVNVISWCPVALQFGLHDITARCSHVAATSFSEIIQTDGFWALGASEFYDYLSLVQEDVLEDSLLEAVLAWTSHIVEERADNLEDLLKIIKLEDCSQEALHQQIDLHSKLLDFRPKVLKSLLSACFDDNQPHNNSKQTKKCRNLRKKISERLVVIGGVEGNGLNSDCWYLDLKTHRMTKFTDIPDGCYFRYSVCKTPDGFVLTGGESSDICAKYITLTGSWVCLPNMPVKRRRHGSIWVNGRLYVIGGWAWQMEGEASRVDYLGADGIWHQGPALPRDILNPVLASIDNQNVYVLHQSTGQLFVLDLSQTYSRSWRDWFWSVWKKRASVPRSWLVGDIGMTATTDRLYVYSPSTNTFAYYTPGSNTWCKTNAPKLQHKCSPLVYCENRLYLMGLLDGDQCNEVEAFDPQTQTWRRMGYRLTKQLWGHQAVALNMPE